MGLECLKLLDPERDGVLKRSIPNLQLSTTRPADYPIFGSSTEVRNRVLDVGFTPKNRHYVAGGACPFRANSGHAAECVAGRLMVNCSRHNDPSNWSAVA